MRFIMPESLTPKTAKGYTRKTKGQLYGRRALKESHLKTSYTEADLMLVGKHGYIYAYSKDLAKVIFSSPRIASRYGVAIKQGEEAGLLVPKEGVETYVKALRVPMTRTKQIRLLLGR